MFQFQRVLSGGDPRTLVGVDVVLAAVRSDPAAVSELLACCQDPDPIVRMRAADALEKYARERPEVVAALVEQILDELGLSTQPSVRWHVAQILGEVPLTDAQQARAGRWLCDTLDTASDWIVLTCALSALAELAATDAGLGPALAERAQRLTRDPRKAVSKRAHRVLAALPPTQGHR